MKYSLVFFALVVMAAVNVSAVPVDAIKPSSAMDDPYNPEKHASRLVSPRPGFQDPDPFRPPDNPEAPCQDAVCTNCKSKATQSACLERCDAWAQGTRSRRPYPRGC